MVSGMVEVLGLIAGFFTTVAFIPQALKSWKSKSSKDMSWGWIILVTIGVFLWLVYGILANDVPVIAANFFTELFALSVLFAKLKFG